MCHDKIRSDFVITTTKLVENIHILKKIISAGVIALNLVVGVQAVVLNLQ